MEALTLSQCSIGFRVNKPQSCLEMEKKEKSVRNKKMYGHAKKMLLNEVKKKEILCFYVLNCLKLCSFTNSISKLMIWGIVHLSWFGVWARQKVLILLQTFFAWITSSTFFAWITSSLSIAALSESITWNFCWTMFIAIVNQCPSPSMFSSFFWMIGNSIYLKKGSMTCIEQKSITYF